MTERWWKMVYPEDIFMIPGEGNRPTLPTDDTDELVAEETEAAELSGYAVEFTGGNEQNILVLVPSEPAGTDTDLLYKILKSAGLEEKDIAIVVWEDSYTESIFEELHPRIVLGFGLDRDPWTSGKSYEIVEHNGRRHIRADALPILGNDTTLKRQLWTQIKVLFNL